MHIVQSMLDFLLRRQYYCLIVITQRKKMKITLRKANAVQNSIQEAIKAVKLGLTVEINEFQDVDATLATAQAELAAATQRRDSLVTALYAVRAAVGVAKASAGIDQQLTEAALIDKRIGFAEETAKSAVMTALDVIKGKIKKLSEGEVKSRIYGYSDTVSTTVVTAEAIEAAKKTVLELKKAKQKINDEVLELNIRTEIELDADTLAVLQAEGLI